MDMLAVVLVGLVAVIGVTALAPKLGMAAPLLLVLLGVGISFIPGMPAVEIEPEWILAGVLPPLLYSTAVALPTMDFRRDFAAIGMLSVALVVLSAGLLGLVFWSFIPDLGLAGGIALGAILSPTDAVATAITKRLGGPPRVVTVLEGEGLLNDATSLVLLRSAVAATAATVEFGSVVGDFVWAVVGAVLTGVLVGWAGLVVRKRLGSAELSTAVSFLVPFAAFIPAEHLHASGLVAVVTAGLVTGHGAAKHLSPQDRLFEHTNWSTLEGLLEGAVFLVMGLELATMVGDVLLDHGRIWLAMGLAVLAAVLVLVIRALFVAPLLWRVSVRSKRRAAQRERLNAVTERLDAKLNAEGVGDVITLGPQTTVIAGLDEALAHAEPAQWRVSGGPFAASSSNDQVTAGAAGSNAAGADALGDNTNPCPPAWLPHGEVPPAPSAEGATVTVPSPVVPAAGVPSPVVRAAERVQKHVAQQGGLPQRVPRSVEVPTERVEKLRYRLVRSVADADYLMTKPLGRPEGILIVWAGMRGVVTLAAAQTLPRTFPHRSMVVLLAFAVAAGTLLVQGGTLPWVLRRLNLVGTGESSAEDDLSLRRTLEAASRELLEDPNLHRRDGSPYDPEIVGRALDYMLSEQMTSEVDAEESAEQLAQYRELRIRTIKAQRKALLKERSEGTRDSHQLSTTLATLDAEQITLEMKVDSALDYSGGEEVVG
ncbi:MAG: cation:proton antiporter [Cellulomonadaceae bacterium]|nr:cation:proton antiporter [Cellulomonadaceae bacterium]